MPRDGFWWARGGVSLHFGLRRQKTPMKPRLCDRQFGLGCSWDADRSGALPVAERAAEERGGAAFSAENDDILMQRQVPVPRHKGDAARRNLCQDPVIGCLLLDSTYARKCWCCSHWFFLLSFGLECGRIEYTIFYCKLDASFWANFGFVFAFNARYQTEGVDLAKQCKYRTLKRENIFSFDGEATYLLLR